MVCDEMHCRVHLCGCVRVCVHACVRVSVCAMLQGVSIDFSVRLAYIFASVPLSIRKTRRPRRVTRSANNFLVCCRYYSNIVADVSIVFFQKPVIFSHFLRKINLPEMVFRPHSGNFPNEVGKPISGKFNLPYMGSENPFRANPSP